MAVLPGRHARHRLRHAEPAGRRLGLVARWSPRWPLLAIVAGIASQYLPDDWLTGACTVFADRRPVVQGGILGLVLLAITTLGPQGVAPFIYYRF